MWCKSPHLAALPSPSCLATRNTAWMVAFKCSICGCTKKAGIGAIATNENSISEETVTDHLLFCRQVTFQCRILQCHRGRIMTKNYTASSAVLRPLCSNYKDGKGNGSLGSQRSVCTLLSRPSLPQRRRCTLPCVNLTPTHFKDAFKTFSTGVSTQLLRN